MAGALGFSKGNFIFGCDLEENLGVLKSADNAEMKVERIKQAVGGARQVHNTIGNLSWAAATVEFNFGQSKGMFQAMQNALDLNHMRFNAFLHRCDQDLKVVLTQELQNCILEEWKLAALDAAKGEILGVTCKVRPERAKHVKGNGSVEKAVLNKEFKDVSQSNFEVEIDGMNTAAITKFDGIGVTCKIKEQFFGKGRVAELLPTAIEFPEFTIEMSAHAALEYADLAHEQMVNGQAGEGAEKNIAVHILHHDNDKRLATFELLGCLFTSVKFDKLGANEDGADKAVVKGCCTDMKATLYK